MTSSRWAEEEMENVLPSLLTGTGLIVTRHEFTTLATGRTRMLPLIRRDGRNLTEIREDVAPGSIKSLRRQIPGAVGPILARIASSMSGVKDLLVARPGGGVSTVCPATRHRIASLSLCRRSSRRIMAVGRAADGILAARAGHARGPPAFAGSLLAPLGNENERHSASAIAVSAAR
jgi:hypothetical protein